jgi:chromate reductase
MSSTYDVAVIVGSLRKESFTRRLAQALIGVAPASLNLEIVEWADVAVFNQDFERDPPAPNAAFRERLRRAEAVLFATPEYNRSIPGGLKNLIDVGSRPYGDSIWNGKPAAVVSNSPGLIGGFGANHHLRQCLVFLNMPTVTQPEAYIAHSNTLVGDDGKFTNEDTGKFLAGFMQTFADLIEATVVR